MAISLTIPHDCNVAACAAESTSRYAIMGVHVKAEAPDANGAGKAWVVATDGRVLSATRATYKGVEGTGPGIGGERDIAKGVIVPTSVLPSKRAPKRDLTLNGRAERAPKVGAPTIIADYVEGSFPPYSCVMPEVSEATHEVIGLNAELLARLQDAIRGDDTDCVGLTLIIPKDRRGPICAMSANGLGVVMPVGLGDVDQFKRWTAAVVELTGAQPEMKLPKPKATRKPKAPAAI